MQDIPRYNVLGVGISALDLGTARAFLLEALAERRKGYVSTADARVVNLAASAPALRAALNASLLTTPDGMPLVWLGRCQGHRAVGRVYGPDLLLAMCEATLATGHSHFFYGAAAGVAEALGRRLQVRFPGLRIAGVFAPPFRPLSPGEQADLAARVSAAHPDFFWVGLGVPEREEFMREFLPRLDTTLMIGVGAAFDLLAGRVPQAPRWMQRSGLEWLYRLGVEPRRLAPRYVRHGPPFLLRAAAQLCGLRKYPLPDRSEAG